MLPTLNSKGIQIKITNSLQTKRKKGEKFFLRFFVNNFLQGYFCHFPQKK